MINKQKVLEGLKAPRKIVFWLTGRKICRKIPDAIYVRIKYWSILGRWPNLSKPRYLSEKIQWLKLHHTDKRYPMLVDKYAVREYIAKEIGEEYLVPIIGVWDKVEDIQWELLPKKFVLKTTDGSHTNIICTDKDKLDIAKCKVLLDTWLHSNQAFYYGREWPYKTVKSRIIAEAFIESNDPGGLVDYKFLCFNGFADNVMVCSDRQINDTKFDHFDREWNFLRYQYVDKDKPEGYTKTRPAKLDEMFSIAEKLAKPFPFVRVDLYCENDKIYFGELTFFPQSGFDTDYTVETDLYFGKLLGDITSERKKNAE